MPKDQASSKELTVVVMGKKNKNGKKRMSYSEKLVEAFNIHRDSLTINSTQSKDGNNGNGIKEKDKPKTITLEQCHGERAIIRHMVPEHLTNAIIQFSKTPLAPGKQGTSQALQLIQSGIGGPKLTQNSYRDQSYEDNDYEESPAMGSKYSDELCRKALEANGPTPDLTTLVQWIPIFREYNQASSFGSLDKVNTLLACIGSSQIAIHNLARKIGYAAEEKDMLTDFLENITTEMLSAEPRYDEGSIWGLKPLRIALYPPYFKTADCLSAAPCHRITEKRILDFPDAFFNPNKQKWTTKDIKSLKSAIRDNLVEDELKQNEILSTILTVDFEEAQDLRMKNKYEKAALGQEEVVEEKVVGPRPRGRPKKSGGKAQIQDSIEIPAYLPEEVTVAPRLTQAAFTRWHDQQVDKLNRTKYNDIVLTCTLEDINWTAVSNKTTAKTKKNRGEEDCVLAFIHDADPRVNSKRWSVEETKRLKELVNEFGENNWERIAELIGNSRTEYQCFYRWTSKIKPPSKVTWDQEKDKLVCELLHKFEGNWKKVAANCNDHLATKNQIIDRYKKSSNSFLRSGNFNRVEDALLLLTIEKLRGHLIRRGHFGELIAYLPWRFETVWRDRAGNLFSDWIVPWTIEEDEKLLKLAETMNRDWRRIAEQFTSFKNRKGCLTRWKILQNRLKDHANVAEYHESYSMIRYNVFAYRHLAEVLEMLKKVYPYPKIHFYGFNPGVTPSTEELQLFLLSFDRTIMAKTIMNLEEYISARDEHWKAWTEKNGEKKRTFDRRTFHEDNPQSVASAAHIRELQLIPKDQLKFKPTPFQEEVYKFYARFRRTNHPLKKDTKRPYLPTASQLAKKKVLRDIIVKGTWQESGDSNDEDDDFEITPKKSRKSGPKKGPPKSTPRRRKSAKKNESVVLDE